MHIIEWTNDFALGIDEIDEQHRALVAMINALDVNAHGDYRPETTRRLLAELNDYVRDHFAVEERLMAGGGCTPELVARHCGEHVYYRSVLKDIANDFEHGRRNVTVTLIEYLVHWLLHHIVVVDRAMAQQLTATEPELAQRVAAAMMQNVTDELTDSERQLLAELRRANDELEQQVRARTQALSAANNKLEADMKEMSATIERLRRERAPGGAAEPAVVAPAVRTALILFALGAPDAEWAGTMRRVCAAARVRGAELRIEQVMLAAAATELRPSMDALLAEGFERIVVLPLFIDPAGALKRDVLRLLEELRAHHPQARLELADAVGEAEHIVQAMATHALELVSA